MGVHGSSRKIFVSMTVSKAGLLQSTFSHVKSSLMYHNWLPIDRGGYDVSINVIKIVLTPQIAFL